MNEEQINFKPWLIGGAIFIGFLIVWQIAIAPIYGVWRREMNGKAELAEATWNRKIKVEEAEANLSSQKLNAQAEIERAKGAAEAQKIIASTLTESYLRYLWISKLEEGTNRQTIYIPTENGLPILEANRLIQ